MTKREICERLLEVWAMEPYKRGEAVRELLLDLAAPETDAEDIERIKRTLESLTPLSAAANLSGSKREDEEKHPGIIVDPSGKNPPRCLRCGRDAEVVHYMGEEWVLCPKCGCAYRIKRGKDEK